MLRSLFLLLSESPQLKRWSSESRLAQIAARRFVAGDTIQDAIDAIAEANRQGMTATLDHLGENTESEAQALDATKEYILALEHIKTYRGLYHVLMGAISPIDGVGPENLRIASLMERINGGGVLEVIVATNPTVEGETTALYLQKALNQSGVKASRIAFGLPVGGDLEFADKQTLSRSFKGRSPL